VFGVLLAFVHYAAGWPSLLGTTVARALRRRVCFRGDSSACVKASDSQLPCLRAAWVWSAGAGSSSSLSQQLSGRDRTCVVVLARGCPGGSGLTPANWLVCWEFWGFLSWGCVGGVWVWGSVWFFIWLGFFVLFWFVGVLCVCGGVFLWFFFLTLAVY